MALLMRYCWLSMEGENINKKNKTMREIRELKEERRIIEGKIDAFAQGLIDGFEKKFGYGLISDINTKIRYYDPIRPDKVAFTNNHPVKIKTTIEIKL